MIITVLRIFRISIAFKDKIELYLYPEGNHCAAAAAQSKRLQIKIQGE